MKQSLAEYLLRKLHAAVADYIRHRAIPTHPSEREMWDKMRETFNEVQEALHGKGGGCSHPRL